jgi:L-gulonate 5-dehydrogenase
MITQTFAARDAKDAFGLIERDPGSTVKVQLDFDE